MIPEIEKCTTKMEIKTDALSRRQSPIQQAFLFMHNHYVVTSSLFILLFTCVCYFQVVNYLESFDIHFFDYAEITDLYQFALGKGIFFKTIVIIAFITLLSWCIAQVQDPKKADEYFTKYFNAILNSLIKVPLFKAFRAAIALILMFMITMMPFIIGLEILQFSLRDYDQSISKKYLNGIAARYNISFRKGEALKCVSIIGGSSDYLFAWNLKNKSPIILAKSNLGIIEQVVPEVPSKEQNILQIVRKLFPNNISKHDLKIFESQNKWVSLLNERCEQKVDPIHFPK